MHNRLYLGIESMPHRFDIYSERIGDSDVGDRCWRQKFNINNSSTTSCHQHHDVINITVTERINKHSRDWKLF